MQEDIISPQKKQGSEKCIDLAKEEIIALERRHKEIQNAIAPIRSSLVIKDKKSKFIPPARWPAKAHLEELELLLRREEDQTALQENLKKIQEIFQEKILTDPKKGRVFWNPINKELEKIIEMMKAKEPGTKEKENKTDAGVNIQPSPITEFTEKKKVIAR